MKCGLPDTGGHCEFCAGEAYRFGVISGPRRFPLSHSSGCYWLSCEITRAEFWGRSKAQHRPEELPPLEAKVTEARALLKDAEVQVKLTESVASAWKEAVRS